MIASPSGLPRARGPRPSPAGAHGPLPRHLPRHPVRPHVRDRADAHLLRHDLVPLRLRRDLGGAPRLGARRLRPPPPARAGDALPRAGGPLHLPLRPLDTARAVADRAAAVPPRPPGLLLRRLARALLPGRDRALDALRGGPRDRGPALLRRPPRRVARRPRGDVPALLAGRRDRRPRRLDRAAGGGRPLRAALPRPVGGRGRARPRRGRGQRADRPLQDPQRPHQGALPPHGGHPGLGDRPHRLERLLAHRRGDGLRVALPRPPLHRLRRLDEHPRVGRGRRQRLGHAGRVPRPALPARAAEAADPRHRPRRRLGRALRPRRGVREGHRGRDEPPDAPLRPQLRGPGREPLRPPAGGSRPLRGAHLHPAHRPLLRRDPDGLRRLLGGGRLRRAVALREPPLHGRGLPGLPRPPHARRAAPHPALGRGRAAPRVERGGAPRCRGGGQARGRSPRDARGRPRGPAADDLHAQEEALDRGRDGPDGRVARRAAGDRPRPARRRALRVALRGPDELRRLRGPGEDPGRPRLRRPALLLRDGRSRGACRGP